MSKAPVSEKLWTEVTTSEFAHERAALHYLRQRFPEREPFRAWANFTFIAEDDTRNEVDLLKHAEEEMRRRGIPAEMLESVLQQPQQVVPGDGGTQVYQSQVEIEGTRYLLRAIVNDSVDPPVVVTVYRTSKINKYWRNQ